MHLLAVQFFTAPLRLTIAPRRSRTSYASVYIYGVIDTSNAMSTFLLFFISEKLF